MTEYCSTGNNHDNPQDLSTVINVNGINKYAIYKLKNNNQSCIHQKPSTQHLTCPTQRFISVSFETLSSQVHQFPKLII